MAKLNPRLLIQIPLLLLGSCTPVIPPTSITIYTNVGGSPTNGYDVTHETERPLTADIPHPGSQTPVRDCVTALEHLDEERAEIGLPDLSKVDGKTKAELNKAVVDLLIAHIKLQREELKRLRTERKCLIGEIHNRRQ